MENRTILLGIKIGTAYGVLRDSYVSFHSEFLIKFSDNYEITIKRNLEYIQDFFGSRVSALTGIVGQNGVGKTTTLNYIKDLFLKEKNDLRHRERDLIFILENGIIRIYLNEDEKGKYTLINNSGFQSEEIYYRSYPKVFDRIKNLTTIFYSNSLDLNNSETETTNFYNLSTGFLLTSIGKINRRLKNRKIRYQTSARRFQFTEFRRQIDFLTFIKSERDLDIPFKYFDSIEIAIKEVSKKDYDRLCLILKKYLTASHFMNSSARDEFEHLEQIIKELRAKFNYSKDSQPLIPSYLKNKDYSELLVIENYTLLLLKLLTDTSPILVYYAENSDFLREITRRISKFELDYIRSSREHINRLYFDIQDVIDREYKHSVKAYGEEKSIEINKLSKKVEEITNDQAKLFKILEYAHQGNSSLQIDLDTVDLGALLENYYSNYNSEFFVFKWPRLSAGEESLISFFSRINAVFNDVKSDNILLLIDEGDLYFHPEWQRKYLYYVLSYLNLQTNFQSIQVILTTHSPFLVSDLPFENLVILDSLENRKVLEEQKFETFGGNIYSLYSKTFFLGGSTISEFAKRKIYNEMIHKIDLVTSNSNSEPLSILISKVGEPVLRSILFERLSNNLQK